ALTSHSLYHPILLCSLSQYHIPEVRHFNSSEVRTKFIKSESQFC
ncbi:11870_t:CDS:1, partial [Funneliformis caledonium]